MSSLDLSVTENFKQKTMMRKATPTQTSNPDLPVMKTTPAQVTLCQKHRNLLNVKRQRISTISGAPQVITVISLHLAVNRCASRILDPTSPEVHRRKSADEDQLGHFGGEHRGRLLENRWTHNSLGRLDGRHDYFASKASTQRPQVGGWRIRQSLANIQATIHMVRDIDHDVQESEKTTKMEWEEDTPRRKCCVQSQRHL